MRRTQGRKRANGGETVLVRIVAKLLIAAEQEGISRGTLLEASGLREETLADPDGRVPLSKTTHSRWTLDSPPHWPRAGK